MENKPVSVWKGTLNSALMLGFVLVIYTLVLYFLDKTFSTGLGLLSLVIMIGGLFLGIKSFRDDSRGGILSYGQSVGAGTVISLYVGIISAVFTYILYTVIDPDLMEKGFTFAEERLIEQGRLSDAMIEQQMQLIRKISSPLISAISGVIGSVFMGVIISLIVAIFVKRDGDSFQQSMAEVEDQPAE